MVRSRIEGLLVDRLRLGSSDVDRRRLLIAAGALVAAGTVWSLARVDVDLARVSVMPLLAVAAIVVPLVVLTNAAEFGYSGRLLGTMYSFRESVPIALAATAANYLPLPGGPLVRVGALHGSGHSMKESVLATATTGFAWIAVGGLAIGLVGLLYNAAVAGLSLAIGFCGGVVFALLCRSKNLDGRVGLVLRILAIEGVTVGLAGLRLYLVMIGLGLPVAFSGAFVVAGSGILASIVGFAPGGLGVTEIGAAAIATAVGIAPEAAFLAAVVDRAIGGVVTAPWALRLAAARPGTRRERVT